MKRLIVKCSWCGRIMGAKDCHGSGKPTLPITHSICPACSTKLEEEMEELFRQNPKPTGEEECHERQS